MAIAAPNRIDWYKAGHSKMFPEGTSLVYSNFTPRSSSHSNIPKEVFTGCIVNFGLQYFCKDYLIREWNQTFFNVPKEQAVRAYKRRCDNALGKDKVSMEQWEALHDLGYMPIEIRALPEGVLVPIKVPPFTVHNTLDAFYWLTNYLESVLSCELWPMMTSATTAFHYRLIFDRYAIATGVDPSFTPFQGHDFSFRGMFGRHAAAMSGAAHLTSFVGSDTVAAIDFLETFYGANSDTELVGCSVPATEHSVMCMGGEDDEIGTIRRIIMEVVPEGIVSVVSDTWDFWQTLTVFAAELKPEIMSRDGKVVFRPDSGDPTLILVGDPNAPEGTPEHKGAVQCLWDIFGGTTNDAGYKVLDSHVGLIYGDSITPQRQLDILKGLKDKGFASSNVVLGIGSFTYQYVTRDTYGFAMKATYGVVNGEGRAIFKNPKTDSGVKKSARGLLQVRWKDGRYALVDNCDTMEGGELTPVFRNGTLLKETTLAEIRARLDHERVYLL